MTELYLWNPRPIQMHRQYQRVLTPPKPQLIAQEWDISVPIKTDNIMAAANMKYLLTAVETLVRKEIEYKFF